MTNKAFEVDFDGTDQYGNVDAREGILSVMTQKRLRKIRLILDGWNPVWHAEQTGHARKDGSVPLIFKCPEIGGTGQATMYKDHIKGELKYFDSGIYVKEEFELLRLSRLK